MENIALIDSMQFAWAEIRDNGSLSNVDILDQLLERIGQEGAPGYECGILDTFSVFSTSEDARIILPTGEETNSDSEARFIANLLALRLFLAAGFIFDGKIISAPSIREPILGGSGQISGNFTFQSATDLALLLRSGALRLQ